MGSHGGTSKYCQNKKVKNSVFLSTCTRAKFLCVHLYGESYTQRDSLNKQLLLLLLLVLFGHEANNNLRKKKKIEHCQITFKINPNEYSKIFNTYFVRKSRFDSF